MRLGNNNNQANIPQPPRGGLLEEVQKIEAATQTIQAYLPRLSAPKLIRNEFFYLWASSLIGLSIFALMTNVFLNFYYAVPEIPRYVKTSASKIALEVNEKVPAEIEEAYQIKLSQINPSGSTKAITANFIAGEEVESLKVRGSLLGKNVNEIVGTVEAKPLYLTQDYQKGIQANSVTGEKYYDVNLAVSGWQKGLIVSNQGHDELYEMNLFKASLGLIEQVDQALRIDLNSFLNQSTDREYALRSYLTYLHNLKTSIEKTQPKVKKEMSDWSKAQATAQTKMTQTEAEFFTALQKFDENKSYASLGQFVEDSQSQVDKKAHLQAMNQLDKYFTAYLPLLTQRLEAVEANREPLVYGVTVVAFRNVDLGLITSQ